MITKAIIKGFAGDNKFKVHIPVLDGNDVSQENLRDATSCTLKGVYNHLAIGDVVFVDFEQNDASKPVILGSLFTGKPDTDGKLEITARKINIESDDDMQGSVKLPDDTLLGSIPMSTLNEMIFWWRNNGGASPSPTPSSSDVKIYRRSQDLPATGTGGTLYVVLNDTNCRVWDSSANKYTIVGNKGITNIDEIDCNPDD